LIAERVEITALSAFFNLVDDAMEFDEPCGINQAHPRRGEPEP
jgi:hypothetical protein